VEERIVAGVKSEMLAVSFKIEIAARAGRAGALVFIARLGDEGIVASFRITVLIVSRVDWNASNNRNTQRQRLLFLY